MYSSVTLGELAVEVFKESNLHTDDEIYTNLFGDLREVKYYYRNTLRPSAEVHFLDYSVLFTLCKGVEFRFFGNGTILSGSVDKSSNVLITDLISIVKN